MVIHTIVFAVLSILSAVAVYATGMPVNKSPPEQQAPDTDETPEEHRCP